MGDRANIVIIQPSDENGNRDYIYLYTHNGGYDLPITLQRALIRAKGKYQHDSRWNDAHYLGRIIFCEMIGENYLGNTGFGMSTRVCDNERPILAVDAETATVSVLAKDSDSAVRSIAFADYCALTHEQARAFRDGEEDS